MRGAVKMLEVAHTILTHEDPDAYMADGPVVEILRSVIKALEYCDGSEPIGEMRLKQRKAEAQNDVSNGEVEESAGDVKASGSSGTASAISDHLDAVEDFAETLVVSVAPSVEMHDKVLGGSVHRLAREIVSRLEAIQELRSGSAAGA